MFADVLNISEHAGLWPLMLKQLKGHETRCALRVFGDSLGGGGDAMPECRHRNCRRAACWYAKGTTGLHCCGKCRKHWRDIRSLHEWEDGYYDEPPEHNDIGDPDSDCQCTSIICHDCPCQRPGHTGFDYDKFDGRESCPAITPQLLLLLHSVALQSCTGT